MKKWFLVALCICLTVGCFAIFTACDTNDEKTYEVSFDMSEHSGMALSNNLDSSGSWASPVSAKTAKWSVWLAPYYDVNNLQIFANGKLVAWTPLDDMSEFNNASLSSGDMIKVGTLNYSQIGAKTEFTMKCPYIKVDFALKLGKMQDGQLVNFGNTSEISQEIALLQQFKVDGTSQNIAALATSGEKFSVSWEKLNQGGSPALVFTTTAKWGYYLDSNLKFYVGDVTYNSSLSTLMGSENKNQYQLYCYDLSRTETNVITLDPTDFTTSDFYLSSSSGDILDIKLKMDGQDLPSDMLSYKAGQTGYAIIRPNIKENVGVSNSELYINATKVEWSEDGDGLYYRMDIGRMLSPLDYAPNDVSFGGTFAISVKNVDIADGADNFVKMVGCNMGFAYYKADDCAYVELSSVESMGSVTLNVPLEFTNADTGFRLTLSASVGGSNYSIVLNISRSDLMEKIRFENNVPMLDGEIVFSPDTSNWIAENPLISCKVPYSGSASASGDGSWSIALSVQLAFEGIQAGTYTAVLEKV